jgi:CRP-like cAMP-binding protein
MPGRMHQRHEHFLRSLPTKRDVILHDRDTARWTTEQVQDVSFLDLPTRLAKALLRLVGENEGAAGDGKLTITQRELSQVIGRSRESTNKQLRIWAKQGWVRLQRGVVTVLQPEKLVEVAAEAGGARCLLI